MDAQADPAGEGKLNRLNNAQTLDGRGGGLLLRNLSFAFYQNIKLGGQTCSSTARVFATQGAPPPMMPCRGRAVLCLLACAWTGVRAQSSCDEGYGATVCSPVSLRQLREPALGDGLECSKRRLPASQASRVASYSCCLRSFVEPRISSNLRLPSQMDQIISVVGEVYSMQLEVDQAITAVMVRAAHRIRRGASSLAAPNSCALFCICRRRTR